MRKASNYHQRDEGLKGLFFGFLFAVIAGPALANSGPAAGQVIQFPMQHYAGHFREHCMTLSSGQSFKMTFRTPHQVRVNVHHHARDKTYFLFNRMFGDAESESVAAEASGEYCIEVTNAENRESVFDVQLEFDLPAD